MIAIIANCTAPNPRAHYNGGRVLEYSGKTTPRRWVWSEGYATKEEARAVLESWAREKAIYYDREAIEEEARDWEDLTEKELRSAFADWLSTNRWYDGPGYYDPVSHEKNYAPGSDFYRERENYMTWTIENI